jgi:hypothetical protein
MADDRTPKPAFDVKLSLILMVIVAICYLGYRVGNGGPRPEDVPCAPGQANLTACNEQMAADDMQGKQRGRDREMKGAAPR